MSEEQRRGPVERPAPSPRALELAAHTAAAFVELRRAHAAVLDAVHALDVEDVAGELGYPSTSRLLHDHVRLDRDEATVLLRHARATHTTLQPSGHPTPPALPTTAAAPAEGTVSDGHVRVIAATMKDLAALPHLDRGRGYRGRGYRRTDPTPSSPV